MNYTMAMILLMAACGAVLAATAFKQKAEWLMNGCLRGVMGAVAIYFINDLLEKQGISIGVGINPVTV